MFGFIELCFGALALAAARFALRRRLGRGQHGIVGAGSAR